MLPAPAGTAGPGPGTAVPRRHPRVPSRCQRRPLPPRLPDRVGRAQLLARPAPWPVPRCRLSRDPERLQEVPRSESSGDRSSRGPPTPPGPPSRRSASLPAHSSCPSKQMSSVSPALRQGRGQQRSRELPQQRPNPFVPLWAELLVSSSSTLVTPGQSTWSSFPTHQPSDPELPPSLLEGGKESSQPEHSSTSSDRSNLGNVCFGAGTAQERPDGALTG